MKTHVEFRSNQFSPYDGEENEINRGRYGKRLAEFLAAGLRSHGFNPSKLMAEDWGWVIPLENCEFKLWIGCGNYLEYDDGFLCFIEPHEPFIRKLFKKIDTRQIVESLQQAMNAVLSENPSIRNIRWWNYEDFNNRADGE